MEKIFKEYVDPSLAQGNTTVTDKEVDLPLGENTLTTNLGIPLIVVVAKVNYEEICFSIRG